MFNNNERDKMSKEYDTTDHITVLSELNMLYQLATETIALNLVARMPIIGINSNVSIP